MLCIVEPVEPSVRWRPRAAITLVFFLDGSVFSAWYSRLPAIQASLHLSPGQVGLALVGAPLGLLVAQPLVGAFISRRGSRPVVAAAPALLATVVLPALAVDARTLLLATTAVGLGTGALDIAMNAQGLVVERTVRRGLFSSLHAAFSFGALAGASLAGAVAAAGVPPLPHLAVCAVLGAAAAAGTAPFLVNDRHAEGVGPVPLPLRPSRGMMALALVAFSALLAEGAVFDWSGIFMARELGTSQGTAALALAAFSLGMGAGRLGADGASARLGSAATGRLGAATAALGLGLALAVADPVGSIVGFALMGTGLSAVFPLTLRAAGIRGGPTALAAISAGGYVGFLAGPPAIGLLADHVGLRVALAGVCLLCALAAVLAGALRTPDRP